MKGQTKSRSGCSACKTRRLKCDETLPGCRNCTRRGIDCPGYRKALKWSSKYESRGGRHATAVAEPADLDRLISAASVSLQQPQQWSQQPSPPPGDSVSFYNVSSTSFESDVADAPDFEEEAETEADQSLVVSKNHKKPMRIAVDVDYPSFATAAPQIQHLSEPQTDLIVLWFKSVCGTWAAYDSPVNPFRCLGQSLWQSSPSLYYSLQSMAAATLSKPSSGVKEVARFAPENATRALIQGLERLFDNANSITTVPADLLMSLFCMSSSLAWMDHRELGLQYIGHARTVIELLDIRKHALSSHDRELLEFFKGCLLYEEAVRSLVTSREDDIQTLLTYAPAESLTQAMRLHSWTGVPPQIMALFGKTMALCRRSRDLWRNTPIATVSSMQKAMAHITEGQVLEETLLRVETMHPSPTSTQTQGPDGSVDKDLCLAAEAYRLSSLLQLYQSFPDLVAKRLPQDVGLDGSVPGGSWLTPLALYIVKLLMDIPADSGMRCLQPLLCLCAGTGLRYEDASVHDSQGASDLLSVVTDTDSNSPSSIGSRVSPQPQEIDLRSAREFLQHRLAKLEQGLPAGPIVVLQNLLRAAWKSYDEKELQQPKHWLDIMASMQYESVFG